MSSRKSKQTHHNRRTLGEQSEKMGSAEWTDIGRMTSEDVRRLVHELQIHQLELELQNEELRNAQVALAESRDRYSDLYEFAPVGYITLEKDDTVVEANLTAAALLGIERGALLRAKFSRFVSRHSQNEWHLFRQAIFSSDTKQICEIETRKAHEDALVVRIEGNAFGPESNRLCRMAFFDITRRKKAEQALEELTSALERHVHEQTAEIRLQAKAIESLGEGVLITEHHGGRQEPHIVFVNEAICRMTGYTAEELIGKTPRILHGTDTDRQTLKRIREELFKGRSAHAELVYYRKDGTPYEVDLFITPLRGESDERTNFVSIQRDITEHKKSERALRKSEQRMRAVLNTAADAIITIDRKGNIVSANPATERMFGYTSDELAGQNVHLLIPPKQKDKRNRHLSRFSAVTQSNTMDGVEEGTGLRKDGATFSLDLAVSEVDSFDLFTFIIRDTSARKKSEQELHQYRNDLRAMSTELILAEDRERQKLAQDLHDGVGQAIFLARRKLDRASVDEAGAILDEIGRMVNALTFELSPPVLRQLGFKSAVYWLARDMKQRYGLAVQVDVDEEQPLPLDGSVALALFRSVRELLINVARHARTDSATISVRKKDHLLEIKIRDRGKGFDPARQARSVTQKNFGLFSTRERLEYLGGTFDLQSAPGKGTRITLTAPLSA